MISNPPLLNIDDVLLRLDGDKSLCAMLFREFNERYQGFGEEMQGYLDTENTPAATDAAHRLKGVALNIGAQQLAALAADFELELTNLQASGFTIQNIDLRKLNGLLALTFTALSNYAEAFRLEAGTPEGKYLSATAIYEQLHKTRSWFDTDYGKALRIMERLAPLCPTDTFGSVHTLLALMKQFDVINARRTLHELTGQG